uniref:Arginine-hydroxylase NDUFAF5, mitochondrial n=1 Tax=Phallusia mammillata TaxID=59560 RepID=A0A6F9DMP0_9ASCI|nr:NADH dehydrogenase [ubiquinone] 1 alpha subcomplex assembly factor 5-like [Phallusia mammillata]
MTWYFVSKCLTRHAHKPAKIIRYFGNAVSERAVFSRRTKAIQKKRAVSSPDVHVFDYLKSEASDMICDRVGDVKRSFPVVLDLSSNRGFLSRTLTKQDGIDYVVQGDICRENLVHSFPSQLPCDSVAFDEELLPYRDNSFDLVLSSMGMHWVNDLPGCFKQILRVLKQDGCFIGVMCGADTLYELRCSLQLAETERESGMAPHISPMIPGHQLANLLWGAGFSLVTLDFDELIVNYPSMFELMEDLQGMAENSAIVHRKMLHRDTLIAAASIYQAMYGDKSSECIPATFQLLFMIGWKPDKSQQKPLERGTVPKGFNINKSET